MCLASAVGFLLLTFAFLACGVGFLAPTWIYMPPGFVDRHVTDPIRSMLGIGNKRVEYEGMLARCFAGTDGCIWFWQNDFAMEKDVKEWHKAAQALYSFGYVILMSTLLLALLHLCCRCCCRKPFSLATVVGSLIVAGSVLIASAIGVFMAFQYKENEVILEEPGSASGLVARFDWGCFVAVGGVLCALISAVFFICEGCRTTDGSRSYDGYEAARTV
jgi:hypothetical protein